MPAYGMPPQRMQAPPAYGQHYQRQSYPAHNGSHGHGGHQPQPQSNGGEAHQVARALPEFRPPMFLGHLPYPESPDSARDLSSPADKSVDTGEVKQLHRRVAELEREKDAADDALRRAVLKLQTQEVEITELRNQLAAARQ